MPSATDVPRRFAAKAFADYEPGTPTQAQALDHAQQLARGDIGSLVLIGPPGVGKTHLGAACVNWRVERDESTWRAALEGNGDVVPRRPDLPLWANVADLIVRLRLDMDRPPDDRDATRLVPRLRSHPGLVVLDDLGREKQSDWTGELVYALVNARYEAVLPTLVTSNLTPADLMASPYWPVISRLAEDGALVAITGADRRLQQ